MSLATLTRPTLPSTAAAPTRHLSAAPSARAASPTTPAAESTAPPRIRAVPDDKEARGFVLYVGLDEATSAAAGVDLATVVAALKRLTTELAPGAQTHAAVALAPRGAGGRNVDVVRLALQDPTAIAQHRQEQTPYIPDPVEGVEVDLSRKRVLIDGESVGLTFTEFELLQYLVLRVGQTVDRSELLDALWRSGDEDRPNERTIDVHVRRLRSKLGGYDDIVRTVRGIGYRFDKHPDVSVTHASTPSPDLF